MYSTVVILHQHNVLASEYWENFKEVYSQRLSVDNCFYTIILDRVKIQILFKAERL